MIANHPVPQAEAEHDFQLQMAFQPIVNTATGEVFAYEALARGPNGEGAIEMLAQVRPETRAAFDRQCRLAAIRDSVRAGILRSNALLAINFLPEVVRAPEEDSLETLRAAHEVAMPPSKLMFEFQAQDELSTAHLAHIIETYRRLSFLTAYDDFIAEPGSMNRLGRCKPDMIKLDPSMVRGIAGSWSRRIAVENLVARTRGLNIKLIAEGVENAADYEKLRALGVRLMQGFYIAKPELRTLPRPAIGQRSAA